jgi:hypothetical protein
MTAAALLPSASDDTIRVGRHRLWALAGFVFFLALGIFFVWMIWLTAHDPKKPQALGLLLLSPFGALLLLWLSWLMVLRLQSGYGTCINSIGITIPGPTYKAKIVFWDDIEAIFAFKIRFNNYTGFRLRDCSRLIAQYSEAEIKILLRRYKWIGLADRVSAPITIVQTDMGKILNANKAYSDLASLLAGLRKAYGCEVYLAAIDRDRNAEDFATYLEGFRQRYSTRVAQSPAEAASHA